MMKLTQVYRNILLLALLLCSTAMVAQKVVFDINGRVNFTQPDETSVRNTYKSSSFMLLSDSTLIRSYYNRTIDVKSDFISNTGYEVNGLFTIKLDNRFTVRTGLGLQFGSFSTGTIIDFISSEFLYEDTIQPTPIIIFSGDSECDCYENSYSDVNDGSNRRTNVEMYNLSVPADIGYDIIPGKLTIRVGGYFQTPLYAASKRSYITLEKTTTGDMTKCKYVKLVETDKARSGVSNFQWGFSSWLNYTLLPNLQLEVGARQQMNNVYASIENPISVFSGDDSSFKPLTFSVGISYRLYKGVSEN